jgi:hypothetical protein
MATATSLFLALVGGLSLVGPAAAADLHCEGTIRSRAGGTIYAAYDPRPQRDLFGPGVITNVSRLRWNPPTGGPINAEVRWGDGPWTWPSPPTGLDVSIELPRRARIDSLTAEIGVRDGATWLIPHVVASPEQTMIWVSSHSDKDYTTLGSIDLTVDQEAGRAILSAIAAGKPIELTVKSNGAAVVQATIHTAGIAARDVLIERMRARIKAQDRAICNDKPDKIEYLATPAKGPAKYTFNCPNPDGTTTVTTVTLAKPPRYDMCDQLNPHPPQPETHQ